MKYFQYYNRQVSTLEYLIQLKNRRAKAQPNPKAQPLQPLQPLQPNPKAQLLQLKPVVVNSARNTCNP